MSDSGTNLPPEEPEATPAPPSPPPGGGWPPPPPPQPQPQAAPPTPRPQGPPFGPPPQPGYPQGPPPGYPQGPPPGYRPGPQPGYPQGPQPGYQQGPPPGYQQGPSGYATPEPAPRAAQPNLLETEPAVVGSLAISLGVIVLWLAALIIAVGVKGLPGKDRLLQFLSPGNVDVAVAMVVAVLLVVVHQRRPGGPAGGPSQASNALLVGIILAAAVGGASFLRGIVELTVAHQLGAVKFGHFVDGLAAVPIAAATVLWALRLRAAGGVVAPPTPPTAAPPADLAPTEFDLPAEGYPTTPTYNPPPLP